MNIYYVLATAIKQKGVTEDPGGERVEEKSGYNINLVLIHKIL